MIELNTTPDLPYVEMPNDSYHAHPSISSSDLKLIEESPVHFTHKELFRFETKGMALGTLVHTLTLEPETFGRDFAIAPDAKRNTIQGKEEWAEFEASLDGHTVITQAEYDTAVKMATNASIIINDLLGVDDFREEALIEKSFFAVDPITGLPLKCRPDILVLANGVMLDLKTTSDISEYGLRKAITNYKYARQIAFYRKALGIVGIEVKRAALVFVETGGGHMVKVRTLPDTAIDDATGEVDRLLAVLHTYRMKKKGPIAKEIEPFGGAA